MRRHFQLINLKVYVTKISNGWSGGCIEEVPVCQASIRTLRWGLFYPRCKWESSLKYCLLVTALTAVCLDHAGGAPQLLGLGHRE